MPFDHDERRPGDRRPFNDPRGRDPRGADPRGADSRSADPRGRGDRPDHDERGFFDRAGDEVRSWFGDEAAERRRQADERHDPRHPDDRGYRGYDRDRGLGRSGYDRDPNVGYGANYGSDHAFGADNARGPHDHDPAYRSWRDRQMAALDRDYAEYRRENQSRFDAEFHSWRQGRQGQRDLLAQVREHWEVVGSDGAHVGTVDHVRDDRIELTKSDADAGGRHHLIPSSWIASVEGERVVLSRTAADAKRGWADEARDRPGGDRGYASRY